MNNTTLLPKYMLYGNKGAVWSKTIHIAEVGFSPTTLCGTPMLATNWANYEQNAEAGCAKCIETLKQIKTE